MLNNNEKIALKKYAHSTNILKFNVGKGTIDKNVLDMLSNALTKHELIKVSFLKAALADKNKDEMVLDLSSSLHADIVQIIGNTAILYKKNPKLPNSILIK
ncbi:MAG: YhbY family RNA-binding protein [Bacilli bacterium]